MTLPTRTVQDPSLGTITVSLDAENLRLVITWNDIKFGFQYECAGVLAARYTEIKDEELVFLAQTAHEEAFGTEDRVLH